MRSDVPESAMEAPGTRVLGLPDSVAADLRRHATRCWPEECCGVLLGANVGSDRSRVAFAVATENAATDRIRRFLVAPGDLVLARRTARAEGLDVVGYYHSHPGGSARPSVLDRRDAWPETSYVILSLEEGKMIEARSWRLGPRGFAEEVIVTGMV